tara:strand:- start:7969 stop:9762 length:1794 start_codon:yes stop_codon:yes gene_type:complete
MDNINSFNQQVQNSDISNNALYNKALQLSNKKNDMIDSLIKEPIQLASGEFLQKGLGKLGGAVSQAGKKAGINLDSVGDMIKEGKNPTDILKDSLQNLKTSFKKPTSLSKESFKINKLVDKSQGILNDNKNKFEQRKTQLKQGIEDEKESGTSFRDIINKTKQKFFGEPKVPFENELTKSEQLDNIRQQLKKSKEGRKALRKTHKKEIENESLKKSGLEPLQQPELEQERPQGVIKGVKKARTIPEKNKEGIASNVNELDLGEDEGEKLKRIREDREIQGGFREPQDKDFLKQQNLRESGYKQGENIATRDSKPISQILQETIEKTAPLQASKPVTIDPSSGEVSGIQPTLQKINPADQTQGIDPATLDEKAGFKRGAQQIKAQRPPSPTIQQSTEQKNIFKTPTDPRTDFFNNLSNMTDEQKTNYDSFRKSLNIEPNDYETKNRLVQHAKNGTIPEELQTQSKNTAENLASQVSTQSTPDSGTSSTPQATPEKIDNTATLEQETETTTQENLKTQQDQLKATDEDDEDKSKVNEDDEELGETAGMDVLGEATEGLANLGVGLGLMLLPDLFESKPKSPPPLELQQETNPSAQFGDS